MKKKMKKLSAQIMNNIIEKNDKQIEQIIKNHKQRMEELRKQMENNFNDTIKKIKIRDNELSSSVINNDAVEK